MEYVRGNVDYLTIAETKKNLLHIKKKLMYEVITINLINLQFICLKSYERCAYIYIYTRVCTRSKASIGYYLERGRKKECMYLKVKLRRSKV